MRLIGISGKSGSGKDWAMNVLREATGAQKWSYAHPLKAAAMSEGFTAEEIETKPPHVRAWMIDYGMEKRAIHPDYWVRQVPYWLTQLEAMGVETVVFPDTRFINEVQFIKQQGGKIIRLWHGDRPYPLKGTQHEWSPSETELDLFGGVDLQFINNLGTTPAQFLHACVKWGIIRHLDIRRDLLSDVFSADVDACVPQVEPTPQTIGL